MKILFCLLFIAASFTGSGQTKATGDTITITDNKIHFIKVDGAVYEIKRATEIIKQELNPVQKVEGWRTFPFQLDSLPPRRSNTLIFKPTTGITTPSSTKNIMLAPYKEIDFSSFLK